MGLHAPRLCIIKRTAPWPCQGACARGLQAAARAHVRVCDLQGGATLHTKHKSLPLC